MCTANCLANLDAKSARQSSLTVLIIEATILVLMSAHQFVALHTLAIVTFARLRWCSKLSICIWLGAPARCRVSKQMDSHCLYCSVFSIILLARIRQMSMNCRHPEWKKPCFPSLYRSLYLLAMLLIAGSECNVASVSNRCQIKMNYAFLSSTVAECFCFRGASRAAIHITIAPMTVAHWQEEER